MLLLCSSSKINHNSYRSTTPREGGSGLQICFLPFTPRGSRKGGKLTNGSKSVRQEEAELTNSPPPPQRDTKGQR